jgi:capsular polysaccharide biosynthesis protein/Mrp family chromosome partitioning ATPase
MVTTENSESDLEFEHWLGALTRRARVFIIVIVLVLALGLVTAFLRPPSYEATADVVVAQPPAAGLLDPSSTATPNLLTELKTAQSTQVTQEAKKVLKTGVKVTVTADPAANSLSFTAKGPTPAGVAAGANAYARAFVAVRKARLTAQYDSVINDLRQAITANDRELAKVSSSSPTDTTTLRILRAQGAAYQDTLERLKVAAVLGGPISARLVEPATIPKAPSSPSIVRSVIYSLVAGLFLAMGAVSLLEFRDKSVSGPRMARRLSGAPVLAMITPAEHPRGRRERQKVRSISSAIAEVGSSPRDAPRSGDWEVIRSLRATITSLMEDSPRILQVTSSAADDGAAGVATDLAISLALGLHDTILVELAPRPGAEREAIPTHPSDGLQEVLSGNLSPLNPVLAIPGVEHLRVLRGELDDNTADVTYPALGRALERFLETSSYVVVHTPPVLSSSAPLNLANIVDATVVCVRTRSTLRTDLVQVSEMLSLVEPGILGLVMTS